MIVRFLGGNQWEAYGSAGGLPKGLRIRTLLIGMATGWPFYSLTSFPVFWDL